MIEKYIEKEIMRQVKLVEYLYECGTLSIVELSKRLSVSYNTVKRDIQSLHVQLEKYIEEFELAKTHISISFNSKYTRYDLILEVYSYSKFLNVCWSYLNGNNDYLSIVKHEYVSTSKAFQLKKKVEGYLTSIGILDENKEWIENEYLFRLVMLTTLSRKPLDKYLVNENKLQRAKELVDKIFWELSNVHTKNKREHIFLALSVYLTITRFKEHPIEPIQENINLKNSLAFQVIQKQMKIFFNDIDLSDDEILFLTSIYKIIPLDSDTYVNLELNYQYERNQVIENNPIVQSLILKFEEEFQNSLFYQMMFERPLILFCYSIFNNLQSFILYRHHYLNEQQIELTQRIKKTLVQWKEEECLNVPFIFNDVAIEWFTSQVFFSLSFKKKQKRVFFIIAENEESHMLYREVLKYWINLDYNIIDSSLYYSLNQLPTYIKKNPHIIVCERSVLPFSNIDHPFLFPISRHSIREDLKMILSEICF